MAMTVEELQARLSEITVRLEEIYEEYVVRGQNMPDEIREEWNQLNEERDEKQATLDERLAMRARIEELSTAEEHQEAGASFHAPRSGVARGNAIYDLTTIRASVSNPEEATRELRDRALRAVEQAHFHNPLISREDAQTRINGLLDSDSDGGEIAKRVLTTGSPTYKRAWSKGVANRLLTEEETRALSLAGAGGGFAVPFTLDPTLLGTSNRLVNPVRSIARVVTITGSNTWQGVTSAGVTATRAAEAAEATDGAPTLVQPSVTVTKVHVFIPFSFEVGQDWGALQSEMGVAIQEAKDDEEATSFVTGDGTGVNPQGFLTGTTNTVPAATGANAFTLANLYALEGALPPRYRARGVYVADLPIYSRIRQFDTAGGAALWVRLPQGVNPDGVNGGNTGHELLGKPSFESTAMPDDATTGNKFLVFGDFSRFLVVDRIGLNIELIPNLFGAAQRPTGQRGLYAHYRNTSKVLDANAFRALIGTA